MNYTIPLDKREKLFGNLREANIAFQKIYPGDRSERQPVHTLYGGANLFKYDSAITLGERALKFLKRMPPIIKCSEKYLVLMMLTLVKRFIKK